VDVACDEIFSVWWICVRRAGRVAAAIETLTEITSRHRPAAEALRDWGKSHRFAGSTDRHAIGTLVYDALRTKRSSAHAAGDDSPRAIVLGALKTQWGMSVDAIAETVQEEHGPGALTAIELKSLMQTSTAENLGVQGDFQDWLLPSLQRAFGADVVPEMRALAARASIDLRVNTLKATRQQVLEALMPTGAKAGPFVATSVRIDSPTPDQKHVNVEAEAAHGKGWFEVQDTASQIAAALAGVKPGQSVADICAGAGGKTLALAAAMNNDGRLIAHDLDKHRLRPIFERITRSGASMIDVLAADEADSLNSRGPFDCVVIDAPCSGSGAWRRKPETKWKLNAKQLEQRRNAQAQVLAQGASLVRPGGQLVYITCSILPEENQDQVNLFTKVNPQFEIVPYAEQWMATIGGNPPASRTGAMLTLTPHSHATDGFYVCLLRKRP
jgi:16S rRNA (cytosine967-C5)-methyltransferase